MSLSKTNEAPLGNELLVGWEAGVRRRQDITPSRRPSSNSISSKHWALCSVWRATVGGLRRCGWEGRQPLKIRPWRAKGPPSQMRDTEGLDGNTTVLWTHLVTVNGHGLFSVSP